MKTFRKYYFLLFCLVLSSSIFPQRREIAKIDSLLDLNQEYSWSDRIRALRYAKDASVIAEKIGDTKKKAYCYFYMAKTLGYLGLTKESFSYLDKTKKEKYFEEDHVLQALVKEENAVNFSKLGLYAEVLKENLEIIQLVKNEESPLAARVKFRAYGNIAANYMNMGDYKNAALAMKREEAYSKEPLLLKTKHIEAAFSNLYANKGYVYLNYINDKDSALHYFNKALALVDGSNVELKAYAYKGLGDYYYKQKLYDTSLEYYVKSVQDLEKRKIEIADLRAILYDRIAKLYGHLGEKEKKKIFTEKYNKENEKKADLTPDNYRKAVSVILQETENDSSDQNKLMTVFFISIVFLTIIFSAAYYTYKSKQNKILLLEKESKLLENNELIQKFKTETDILKKQTSFSVDELIGLAKNNDSKFYSTFNQTFPMFEKILLDISPTLNISDFKILAYIYLNFDTKQIADSIFKSVRTIQNKKYALRKKLGIQSSEDIYRWLKIKCG